MIYTKILLYSFLTYSSVQLEVKSVFVCMEVFDVEIQTVRLFLVTFTRTISIVFKHLPFERKNLLHGSTENRENIIQNTVPSIVQSFYFRDSISSFFTSKCKLQTNGFIADALVFCPTGHSPLTEDLVG